MKTLTLILAVFLLTNPGPAETSFATASLQDIIVGETWRIPSPRLREEREIRVFLPPSYASTQKRFPVIYVLDGEGLGPITANAAAFMTGTATIPQMPEAIIVGIHNTDRNRDMPIPPEYGKGREDSFLAFLADELIPAVERKYRTQRLRVLVGHSQGGLFAVYALTARPEVFQWFLPMDAPLSGFPEVQQLMDKAEERFSHPSDRIGRIVTIETLYGWKKSWPFSGEAAPKGFWGDRMEIPDETHETMAYRGVYEGLKRLFHDYAPNLVRDTKGSFPLPALEERYQALSEAYGYQVDIPRQVLLMSATQLAAVQKGVEALELVNRAIEIYGASEATSAALAKAQAAIEKGRDPRLEEWANMAPPAAEELAPFLGTWERVTEDGARWFITFEARNGLGLAINSVTPPSGESFQLEIAFVKVLEGQVVQWGERNGRGPGVTIFTARLTDEHTLEGTTEAVGFIQSRPAMKFAYKLISKNFRR